MTPENEYEREGAGPMPVQSAEAVGLEGVDEPNQDVDPAVAAEVQLQEETRETEAEHGAEEDAVEDPRAEAEEETDAEAGDEDAGGDEAEEPEAE